MKSLPPPAILRTYCVGTISEPPPAPAKSFVDTLQHLTGVHEYQGTRSSQIPTGVCVKVKA